MAAAAAGGEKVAWWRRALPFVLAGAMIAFVLARLDRRAFLEHLAQVSYPLYLGFALLFLVSLLAADAFATVLIYRRSVAPIRYRDFLVLRGASYLPSILNHHLGQAFITYFLSRAYGVTLWRVAGATLLVYASWMACVLGLLSTAIVMLGKPLWWLAGPLGAGGLYLVVLAWRPAVLARRRLLAPLFEAGITGHLHAVATRLPHLVVLFAGTYVPFLFFDVRIPPAEALATIPIMMVAVTLPITAQGIGTRDVLASVFYERFAAGETREQRLAAIAASTATWAVAITLAEIVVGVVLMYKAMPALRARAAAAAAAAAPAAPPAPGAPRPPPPPGAPRPRSRPPPRASRGAASSRASAPPSRSRRRRRA